MVIVGALTPAPTLASPTTGGGHSARADGRVGDVVNSRIGDVVGEFGRCEVPEPLAVFASGPQVACLQLALALGGWLVSPITDIYDAATVRAVLFVQAARPPMKVDGVADEAVLRALGLHGAVPSVPRTPASVDPPACFADAPTAQGDAGEGVACVQAALAATGLYHGPYSGTFDRQTADALRSFQLRTPPLTVNGIGGPQTLAALGVWSGVTEGGDFRTMPVGAGPSTGNPRQPSDPGVPAPPGPWPAPWTDLPQWWVDDFGIPAYGNRNPCSVSNADIIAYEFARDGADVDTQRWAVYVASRESNCDYTIITDNPATRDLSMCAFQLNALAGMFEPRAELGRRGWTTENVRASMYNCADAASDLWVFCGRGPWTKPYSCTPPWRPNG